MDRPSNSAEETAESVNLGDQGLLILDPSESVRSESHAPAKPNEVLLRISQDMARVLERLIAPKAPIDMLRRHGAKEFHGSNLEKSDKDEFWLEKMKRIVEEVRCPLDQRVTCEVSLLQGSAYDWFGLVLRNFCIKEIVRFQRNCCQVFSKTLFFFSYTLSYNNPNLVILIGK